LRESILERIFWLTINVYHEARNQPEQGQILVCKVVLNRVKDKRWPSTVKGVVWQHKQFSWTLEPRLWHVNGRDKYKTLLTCAKSAWKAYLQWRVGSRAGGINHYHRYDVYPVWRENMAVKERVADHIFYVG